MLSGADDVGVGADGDPWGAVELFALPGEVAWGAAGDTAHPVASHLDGLRRTDDEQAVRAAPDERRPASPSVNENSG